MEIMKKEVEALLEKVVKLALVEQIEMKGMWNLSIGFKTKLDRKISDDYGIEIRGVHQEDQGEDFEIRFNLKGLVAELFEENELPPFFSTYILNNSGEEWFDFSSTRPEIYGTYVDLRKAYKWPKGKLEKFVNDIGKIYTLKLIQQQPVSFHH